MDVMMLLYRLLRVFLLLLFAAPLMVPALPLGVLPPRTYIALASDNIQKRQIYREKFVPTLGGAIPAGALSRERLKHNSHDAVGIEAPDGLVFQPREIDIRPGLRDPEDTQEILTLSRRPHPQEPTDFNGMMPPKPQPTTYLLRRPSGNVGGGGPIGILKEDASDGSFNSNSLVSPLMDALPFMQLTRAGRGHQTGFVGTGYLNNDYNGIGPSPDFLSSGRNFFDSGRQFFQFGKYASHFLPSATLTQVPPSDYFKKHAVVWFSR